MCVCLCVCVCVWGGCVCVCVGHLPQRVTGRGPLLRKVRVCVCVCLCVCLCVFVCVLFAMTAHRSLMDREEIAKEG